MSSFGETLITKKVEFDDIKNKLKINKKEDKQQVENLKYIINRAIKDSGYRFIHEQDYNDRSITNKFELQNMSTKEYIIMDEKYFMDIYKSVIFTKRDDIKNLVLSNISKISKWKKFEEKEKYHLALVY